nr:hypothetical protein [Tanacetum cinerariifolium]
MLWRPVLIKYAEDADLSEADYCTFLEGNLERGEGTYSRAASAPSLRLVDTMDVLAQSALARDQEYDQNLDYDFSTATLGEEIDLTLFPLVPGPFGMPYPFADGKGSDSPKYTREEWDGSHASEANILSKEFFKDPNVCRRALDQTITLAELKRTESLLLLQLSNWMSVLTTLLTSQGREMNSRYTALALVVRDLENDLALERSKYQEYRDAATIAEHFFNKLRSEVFRFVGSGVDGLVRKLLSSDQFNATLARILYLGITSGVEMGLCMGRADAEFEEALMSYDQTIYIRKISKYKKFTNNP